MHRHGARGREGGVITQHQGAAADGKRPVAQVAGRDQGQVVGTLLLEVDIAARDRPGEGRGRVVLHHEERGGRGRAVGDRAGSVGIDTRGELREATESLGVAVEVEGAAVDIEVGHRGHGSGRDDQERIDGQDGPEPQRAVVHGGTSGVITSPGKRHHAVAGLDQAARTQGRRTEGERRGATEHVEVQRVGGGGHRAAAEAGVTRVDDEAAAGVGEGVERAAETEELTGRTLRRTQIATAEGDPAAAVERQALDGRRLLEDGRSSRDEIGGGGGAECQPVDLGAAGGRSAQGDGVSGDGADHRVRGHPGAADRHAREETGGVRDRDGRRIVDARREHDAGARGRGEQTAILGGGQQTEAVGVVGDEAAAGIAAVDADDVRADTVGDQTGDRRIGAYQVRRRGDDIDAVGAGGTSAQRARGAGVQRQRPMQRRALGAEAVDGNMSLVAGVLRQVPDRLAGDVLDRPEGLDDGGGGTAGVIQHTSAIIEHTVVGGLDGTDAAETVAEGVRAVEREHAAAA